MDYNILYNNRTGQIVLQKKAVFDKTNCIQYDNNSNINNNTNNNTNNNIFNYKNIDDPNKVNIEKSKFINKNNQLQSLCTKKPLAPNILSYNEFIELKKKNNDENIYCESSKSNTNDSTIESEKIKLKEYIPQENNNQNIIEQIKRKMDQLEIKKNLESSGEFHKNNFVENNNIISSEEIIDDSTKSSYQEIANKLDIKKNNIYGIKKTILSDLNFSNNSSNSSDFRIGLNNINNSVNCENITPIFDTFYLFPNIIEINTKSQTNIVSEKKIEIFENINDLSDKQYFPIDFIPTGINIPFKNNNTKYEKIKISNIYWNIFQSITNEKYKNGELLSVIPNKTEFIYNKIILQVNFELHSQISNNYTVYKNDKIKNKSSADTCLYKVYSIMIDSLNGSNYNDIIIDLSFEHMILDLNCALLCVKISVSDESIKILKGADKNNNIFYGYIPFSQFILQFDYELVENRTE
jgi:hypothetical protein